MQKTVLFRQLKDYMEKRSGVDVYIFHDKPHQLLFYHVKEVIKYARTHDKNNRCTILIIDKSMSCYEERFEITEMATFYEAHSLQLFFRTFYRELLETQVDAFRRRRHLYEDFPINMIGLPSAYKHHMFIPMHYDLMTEMYKICYRITNVDVKPIRPQVCEKISNHLLNHRVHYKSFINNLLPTIECFKPRSIAKFLRYRPAINFHVSEDHMPVFERDVTENLFSWMAGNGGDAKAKKSCCEKNCFCNRNLNLYKEGYMSVERQFLGNMA